MTIQQTKVEFINIEQLKRALILLWLAKVPAAIIGGTGSGKTTAVRDLVATLNKQYPDTDYKLWPVILSLMPYPEDIAGIPYPNKDRKGVSYLPPDILPYNCKDYGIIFGDEFDRTSVETQNAFLQILLGGKIHNNVISENAYTILAMNGTSDIYTTQLSEAARTRVATLFVSAYSDGASDSYDDWADNNNISPLIRGFAKFRPDLIAIREDFEELAVCNPRTRDMADSILTAVDRIKFKTDDIIRPCLAGVVGRAVAIELLAYKAMYDKLPKIEDILKDTANAPLPTEPCIIYALICALSAHVSTKLDSTEQLVVADKILNYVIRLPDEMTATALRKLNSKVPQIVSNPDYIKWANDHSLLLT